MKINLDESGCESDMAEGAEETENSSNADIPTMLGTILPCEVMPASIGGIKREFDTIHHQQQQQIRSESVSPIHQTILTGSGTIKTGTSIISSTIPDIPNTTTTTATSIVRTTSPLSSSSSSSSSSRSAESSRSSSGNIQQNDADAEMPINLKSEDGEKDICHRLHSSSPTISLKNSEKEKSLDYYRNLKINNDRSSPSLSPHHDQLKVTAGTAAQAHLNGTMQDMINLQKLQNLASIQQQQQQQHSSVPAALASLQGLAGISSASALNSPLNLSVGSTSNLLSSTGTKLPNCDALGGNGGGITGCSPHGSSQMPQLILASGQLVQGVQGAQLLIPTSQGIAIQTILTIPVSQQINTNEQFLQSYAALNSGAAAFNNTTLGHQISLPPPQSNYMNPNLFSNGVQQLLAALHPQLFSTSSHHPNDSIKKHQPPIAVNNLQQQIHKQQLVNHHHSSESLSPKLEGSQRLHHHHHNHQRESSPSPLPTSSSSSAQHLRLSPLTNLNLGQHSKQQPQSHSPSRNTNFGLHLTQEKPTIASTSPSSINNNYTSTSGSQHTAQQQLFNTHSPNSHMTSSSHSLSSQVNSPSSVCVLSSINRLTSTNGELTITKSHGPTNPHHHSMNAPSSSSPSPSSAQPMKLSPSSMHLSPTGTENSTTDLLVDSPNEPTINQTNCNVVDGIDLDEIKEFAKAFKLRRLSLGLTQTQVGQALSVTEGPAYSQSAICSALAAQMYAAQLSSQQQNMFEKLDITPKSAQKIKPVLERWMKEAEESHWNRYKTGQNHLTDFIGVEPSKKRKRRTSFTPQALELLNAHFERNTHPSGTEITGLAHQLGYEREVIRIWFCNKRQALKNTVRMMSKGMV